MAVTRGIRTIDRRVRKVFFWIHLVLAFAAGLVIVLLCLTGAALAFEKQIVAWADPKVTVGSAALPPDELLGRAAAIDRALGNDAILTLSARPNDAAIVAVGRDKRVLINPYTGESLGAGAARTRATFTWIMQLHRWLVLNGDGTRPVGKGIIGAANLMFVVVLMTGLVIWFPRQLKWRNFKTVLFPRVRIRGKARDWNWHHALGIWSLLPLLAMALTGAVISYTWAGNLLTSAAGGSPPPSTRPAPAATMTAYAATASDPAGAPGFNLAVAAAKASVDGWTRLSLRLPAASAATFTISVDRGTPGQPQLREQLTFGRDGTLVKREPFGAQEAPRRARQISRFLHTGEVLGVGGQLVFGLASFAGAVLGYTGVALSWRRFRGWQRRRGKA